MKSLQEILADKRVQRLMIIACTWCALVAGLQALWPLDLSAFEWVPSDKELQKYRRMWNPLSNGPMFISGVDLHPTGQFTAHPFVFSQISEKRFGNDFSVRRTTAATHSYQVAPVVIMAYGITDHLELNVGLSPRVFGRETRRARTAVRADR